MSWFKQLGPDSRQWFRNSGARYAVAVIQRTSGNSGDHAMIVHNRIGVMCGLHTVIPGGDSWDNPCMCVALFVEKSDAEECRGAWPDSQLLDLSDVSSD